jgi:four helix bundle protein
MGFHVSEVSFELIDELRPIVEQVRRRERSLADQLVRAANSIVLNIEEARGVELGNQRLRFMTASGSARETRAALRLAVRWRLVPETQAVAALDLLERILAMLWRLTKGRQSQEIR